MYGYNCSLADGFLVLNVVSLVIGMSGGWWWAATSLEEIGQVPQLFSHG